MTALHRLVCQAGAARTAVSVSLCLLLPLGVQAADAAAAAAAAAAETLSVADTAPAVISDPADGAGRAGVALPAAGVLQPWLLAQAAEPPLAPLLPPAGALVAPPDGPQDRNASETPPLLSDTPEASGPQPTRFNYAIGVAYAVRPSYAGSDERKSRLRPVLALQYGRFRLSSSRGSSVLRHGLDTRGSGASATLIERDRFNISASLRIDNGRDASDATRLAGLPEVRTTLRGRMTLGYALTDRWSAGASVSQDLLGRSGGAQFNTGLQYALNLTPQTRFNVGAGAAFGDATFMRSQFGVPDSAPGQGSALAPFTPGAGLYNLNAGMGVMTALSRRWVVFGAVTLSQLRGDARRSPLTVRPNSYSATAGIAYRCCP